MRIHHFGYMVKNIEKSLLEFQALGFLLDKEPIFDELRKAKICFINKDGYCLELISPQKDSYLYELLKKYKNTAYHICYETNDIETAIESLENQGFTLFKEIQLAPAIAENAKVAFLMGAGVGMIEIVEDYQ